MSIWNVEFSYNLSVEADTVSEAEQQAIKAYDEMMPRTDEMNIEATIETNKCGQFRLI